MNDKVFFRIKRHQNNGGFLTDICDYIIHLGHSPVEFFERFILELKEIDYEGTYKAAAKELNQGVNRGK